MKRPKLPAIKTATETKVKTLRHWTGFVPQEFLLQLLLRESGQSLITRTRKPKIALTTPINAKAMAHIGHPHSGNRTELAIA